MLKLSKLSFHLGIFTMFFLSNYVFSNKAQAEQEKSIPPNAKIAIVAGGCFWCIESDFLKVKGVYDTKVGYIGGSSKNPTYNDVSAQTKVGQGHYEALKIYYDPMILTYYDIIDYFFKHINPIDGGGQFCDRGLQYSTAIFYLTEEEKQISDNYIKKLQDGNLLDGSIQTKVIKANTFWLAEDYHQKYALVNPLRYSFYRKTCGRDSKIATVWEKYHRTKQS